MGWDFCLWCSIYQRHAKSDACTTVSTHPANSIATIQMVLLDVFATYHFRPDAFSLTPIPNDKSSDHPACVLNNQLSTVVGRSGRNGVAALRTAALKGSGTGQGRATTPSRSTADSTAPGTWTGRSRAISRTVPVRAEFL